MRQRGVDHRLCQKEPLGPHGGHRPLGRGIRSYSRKLCERNARAEGVSNITFQQGDARHLDFPDETFDAVTSSYVYHNITGADKQALLRESCGCVKKGGVFASSHRGRPFGRFIPVSEDSRHRGRGPQRRPHDGEA